MKKQILFVATIISASLAKKIFDIHYWNEELNDAWLKCYRVLAKAMIGATAS